VFDRDALRRLQAIFKKVALDFQAQLVEMNGEAEHLRLFIHYPPKHSVSSMVKEPPRCSSRLLRIERPDTEKRYGNNVLWSPSYFAANCGGAPLGTIKHYVEQQKTPL
jgi:REP-associated tyrosine transposase